MQTHHVSLLSGEIEKNKLFYMQILGLRFIKNSINQANAHMRHIYYGDFMGRLIPSSLSSYIRN